MKLISPKGREPNPATCEAIRERPPISTLTDVKIVFLKLLTNYVSSQAGLAYAKLFHPSQPLVGKDATRNGLVPQNKEQLAVSESLEETCGCRSLARGA